MAEYIYELGEVSRCDWDNGDVFFRAKMKEKITRCKDCKYRDCNGYCHVLGDMFSHWEDWDPVPDDFFCARGERTPDA